MKFTQVTSADTEGMQPDSEPAQADSGQSAPEQSDTDSSKGNGCGVKFTRVEPGAEYESNESTMSDSGNAFHVSDIIRNASPPLDALHKVGRDITRTIAMAQCLPDSFVMPPTLAHAAAAIGNSFEVRCYPDGGAEPVNLWCGVLAGSGMGKTEVLKKLGKPFEVIDQDYSIAFKEESVQYERDKKAKDSDIAPVPPIEKHLVVGDATMEAIFVMCGNNPHGLLLSQAEGRLFFSMDSYRTAKTDEPNYCRLYDRTRFKISRKGAPTISGTGMISVAMMIQPSNFVRALEGNPGMKTSGLLARLNLCHPVVGEFRIAEWVDTTAYQNWDKAIMDIVEQRTDGTPVPVYLDDKAQTTWRKYMADCRNLARRTGGWLGGYYDRLHVTAIRLALQFYVFEGGAGLMKSSYIDRAIAVAEYMRSQNEQVAGMFAGEAAGSGLSDDHCKVLKILRQWEPATEGELKKHSRVLQAMTNLADILRQLVKMKVIYENFREGKGVDGRIIIEYSTVPPVTVAEPPVNPDDFEGSGYGYGTAPQNECSETDPAEVFADDQPTESAVASAVNLSGFADIIRQTFLRPPGVNTVIFERDILPMFDGDRVPASAFLHEHGFEVKEIDGELRVLETRTSESAPAPPSVVKSELPESAPEQSSAEVVVCCENCQHFSGREISPRGLCRKGLVQQDSPDCPKFQLPSK
jgi:hypothetical protein